jgi:membrane-associated phospholipid phosphatase
MYPKLLNFMRPAFRISPLILAAITMLYPLHSMADVLGDLSSPVNTPAVTPFIIGVTASITLAVLENRISDPIQRHFGSGPGLGKALCLTGDYGGQFITNGIYTAGMLTAGWIGYSDGVKHASVMALASTYAVGLSTILKITVREPRPYDGNIRNSFPSGHTTAAFAFASVVGAEHGWPWGIPAYALAIVTATERLVDNKHYLHDLIAGATIGISYGLGIHYIHGKRRGTLSIAPFLIDEVKGAMIGLRF